MKKTIEFDQECQSCGGTGLYIGMAERDGAAVVCCECDGTGMEHFKHTFNEFVGRKEPTKPVRQVYQTNPGITIGEGGSKEFKLSDFGGMSYSEWEKGSPFKVGMENRAFTCPAWWYQKADYKKKPGWDECNASLGRSFSGCPSFQNRSKCWERWDKEFGGKP